MKRLIAMGVALIGLAAAWAAPAVAQTPTVQANRTFNGVYTIRARGVAAGDFALNLAITPTTYQGTMRQRATGLVRLAVENSLDYDGSARGAITATAIRPATYTHQGGRRGRVVTVTYTANDVVTEANPPMNMGNPPATRQQKLGSTDQISSFVHMMVAPGEADPCARTIRVFDGRARFDLVMRPNGTQNMRQRVFRGEARRCTVSYRAIAGLTDAPPTGENMTFLFGRLANGLWAPLRIEWPTDDAGMAILELRELTAT
ncbi:MAG: DUF3108 domain-containing protein [Caulobacterales bacterium]|jgi:hypothetical protein